MRGAIAVSALIGAERMANMYGFTCAFCGKEINRDSEAEARKAAQWNGWAYTKDLAEDWHVSCPRCIEESDESMPLTDGVPNGSSG